LLEDNTVAAMLTMLPLALYTPSAGEFNAKMLYAIATHPDFQGRGLASQLIKLL
jgi:ribosomal protein S18 acetylase RimI-like enzyme